MKWFSWFKRAQPAPLVAITNPPPPQSKIRDYNEFVKEGYKGNVVAFRSIEKITDGLADVQLLLKRKRLGNRMPEEVTDHPILTLLEKPNMMQSYQSFVKQAFGYFLISGNTYIQCVGPGRNQVKELLALRPDRMTVLPSPFMVPSGFKYKVNQTETIFPMDVITGDSPVLHMKTFNPNDDWLGMSFIEASAFSVDQHNATGRWNLSLLENSGRPSGALVMTPSDQNPSGQLNEEQRNLLKAEIDRKFSGSRNAGRPLLLEGGLDWKEMSFNPKDMDWLNGRNTNAREIAFAFGVPPQLLGIPGDNTFSNYEQAKQALFIDVVIPLSRMWVNHLNSWLVPAFGDDGLFLEPDINSIEALEPMRREKWTQTQASAFLTINEKRERLGFGRYMPTDDAADKIFVPIGQIPLELAAEDDFLGDDDDDTSDFEDPDDDIDDTDDVDTDDDDDGADDEQRGFLNLTKARDLAAKKTTVAFVDGKAMNLTTQRSRQRFRSVVVRKRERMGRAFRIQLKAAFKQEARLLAESLKGIDSTLLEFALNGALQESRPVFEKVMTRNMKDIIEFFASDVLDLAKLYPMYEMETKDARTRFESTVDEFIKRHAGDRITKIQGATKKRVLAALRKELSAGLEEGRTPDQLVKKVEDIYAGFTTARAATIVKTEVGVAQNEGQRAAARALALPNLKKTWIAEMRERTRTMPRDSTDHRAMHEVTIDVNSKFEVPSKDGKDMMDGPGDPSAPADQVINCHCVNVFQT